MAIDIIALDPTKETNTVSIVCSTSFTGYSSKKTTVSDAPTDQQIENIESKYDNKFDDPTYYFDDGSKGG